MEHDEAVQTHAAEQYVAGELSREQLEAFEDHLFECAECAKAVRFELNFAASVRHAAVAPAPGFWEKLRAGLQWQPRLTFAYGLNIVLVAGCVFFALMGRQQPIPPQFAESFWAPGPVKGDESANVHNLTADKTVYAVHFPLSPDVRTYAYEILAADGHRECSAIVAAPSGQQEQVPLLVPLAGLRTGLHALQVHAGSLTGDVVSRSEFRLLAK